MQFGLFGAAQAQRGGPDVDSAAGFKDYIEYVIEAEALGYHSAFIVEHHFTGFGPRRRSTCSPGSACAPALCVSAPR
jgi:alkanesulfonate monooxygenase SsuD/methylene tetrahydromethanopterin reductase-like flavin-dependent oxidoreductase (luciferase family)